MLLNDNKAGMEGLDKTAINRIIEENTNAQFGHHSQKRAQRIAARVERNQRLLAATGSSEFAEHQKKMDELARDLETDRDLSRCLVHVDMDAFYGSVEMRDDPSLRNIPMAVGSDSMLSTSNYAARRFGVRAAMPGFLGRKLCPDLRIVPCNFAKYRKASHEVRAIFAEYDPHFAKAGLDEAYLDLTDAIASRVSDKQWTRVRYAGECQCRLPRMEDEIDASMEVVEQDCTKCTLKRVILQDTVQFGSTPDEIVAELRFRVQQKTGLTCSAGVNAFFFSISPSGIAPNTRLAKVCSDVNKPNGQFRVRNDADSVARFVESLPIRKVSGIGSSTEAVLSALEIRSCGDLWRRRELLPVLFSPISCRHFIRIALGLGSTRIADDGHVRKSISVERTFSPIEDLVALIEIARGLASELHSSLPDHGILGGRCVTMKIKFASFDVVTRSAGITDEIVRDEERLCELVEAIIRKECQQNRVRLLGVRLSRLVMEDEMLENGPALPSIWGTTEGDDSSRCPICNRILPVNDDRRLNEHIDNCLNRKAIEEINDDQRQRTTTPGKRKGKMPTGTKKMKKSPRDSKQSSIVSFFGHKDK